jgi:predicted membrane channel-forming protein YqfA (hemolysin III family)
MNIEKVYSTTRAAIIVGCLSFATGGFYAVIVAGVCCIIFKLNENTALIWIGVPLFVLFTVLALIYLPKYARKAGFID